jgi:hypothetical protein
MTKICHSERSEESKKRREKDSRFHGEDKKFVIASVAKQSKKEREKDSHFHGNDKTNRQSPVIASPDLSGRSNPKKNFSAKGGFMK